MRRDDRWMPDHTAGVRRALLLALAVSASACRPSNEVAAADSGAHGAALFEAQCALCHGAEGRADGPAALLLFPPPRDFGRGRFKVASTTNGAPTDEDLMGVLRRGLPGSAMPSWSWMSEDDLLALARHVRELAVAGVAEEASLGADALDPVEARRLALARLTPGAPVKTDIAPAVGASALERGRSLFETRCAACHGADGKGRPDVLRPDEDGTYNHARDFTTGILQGGGRPSDLARSVLAGMHGTAMPASDLDPTQLAELLVYLDGLIPDDAHERLVQHPSTIVAQRSPGDVPTEPADGAWRELDPVRIVLAPLWWREGAILTADVRALHDDEQLAVHVRWDDATHEVATADAPPYDAPRYADALALQFSALEHPPFFGMGSGDEPTQLWHWRATHPFGREQLDWAERLLSAMPHALGDWQFAGARWAIPEYAFAWGSLEIQGSTATTIPEGLQYLEAQTPAGVRLRSAAHWADGAWEVVLVGPLGVFADAPRELRPEHGLSLNLALWNGAIGDLRGQKSITIWHRLELAGAGI